MQLTLTDAQVSAVISALDSYLADLRDELADTDSSEVRQTLRDLQTELAGVRAQLGGSGQSSGPHSGAGGSGSAPA